MGALQQYLLARLASGHSHSDRLLFRSSAPIGIYIDGLKHFAQRDQRRTIELWANGNVKDRNSLSRQSLFNERVKVARAHIGWNTKLSKCIQQNYVIAIFVTAKVG